MDKRMLVIAAAAVALFTTGTFANHTTDGQHGKKPACHCPHHGKHCGKHKSKHHGKHHGSKKSSHTSGKANGKMHDAGQDMNKSGVQGTQGGMQPGTTMDGTKGMEQKPAQ